MKVINKKIKDIKNKAKVIPCNDILNMEEKTGMNLSEMNRMDFSMQNMWFSDN